MRIDRLRKVIEKPKRRVVGLMSGTSVDAIDAAMIDIEGHGESARIELLAFDTFEFPPPIRARLFKLFDPAAARIDQICNLDFLMGELFAEAIIRFLATQNMAASEIDLIGSAGQTIWHDPEPIVESIAVSWLNRSISTRSTLAIGQSAVIAERTGIITIGDLRVRDVAAGGHGAPLMAYADWVLLRDDKIGRCVQNIGGIGNVTYLPPKAEISDVIAFDTGPGNMVIDALTEVATSGKQKFDRDGKFAKRGTSRQSILSTWLEDPYFEKPPPKTTGREHFGVQFARRALTEFQGTSIEDLIATATELTAASIANSYRDFIRALGPIDQVVIGGGGASNPTLVSMLERHLPGVSLLKHEDLGINSKAKEAIGIAVIANDAIAGMSTNVTGATGGRPTVLGKINL